MDVLDRARQDIAAGRWWKARDRLLGATVARADDALLGLLGEVQFAMRDLPAAGAAWYGTGRTGPDARAADDAWRARHGNHAVQLWLSLPGAARHREDDRCRELRDLALGQSPYGLPKVPRPALPRADRGRSPGDVVAGIAVVLVVAVFLACTAVGAWTLLRWALP